MKAKYDIRTGNFLVFLDNQVLEYSSKEFEDIYYNFIEELSLSRVVRYSSEESEPQLDLFK